MKGFAFAVAGALLAVAAPASADTVTFSQVSQQNTAKPFSYTTAGQTTTFKLAGTPSFNLSTLDFLTLVAPIETVAAELTAASSSQLIATGPSDYTQLFQSGAMSFKLSGARAQALTGDATKTNLLTVNFANGTLYGRAHVEAMGGVGKIVETVKPAVVRELPAALYVQLTDSVATATGAEAAAKQRAFPELVAPLLRPPPSA